MLRMAFWPPEPETTTQWVSGHAEEWGAGDAYRFCITQAERVIGLIDVDEIHSGKPHLGYWLHPEVWGKGFAKEAAARVVQFAREDASLSSLTAGHAADNPASGRVLAHVGFEQVGSADAWSKPHSANVLYHFWHLQLGASTQRAVIHRDFR